MNGFDHRCHHPVLTQELWPSLRRIMNRWVWASLIILIAVGNRVRAQSAPTETIPPTGSLAAPLQIPPSQCGVYSLFTCATLLGRDIEMTSLLQPKYIGSAKGSSISELASAAREHGLYSFALKGMTSELLRRSRYPLILHVKGNRASSAYDHFFVCVGVKDDAARILDAPNPEFLLPLHELALRWDGSGLAISDRPFNGDEFAGLQLGSIPWFAGLGMLAFLGSVAIHHWMFPRNASTELQLGKSVLQGGSLCALAILVAFIYHFTSDEGFFAHGHTVAPLQRTAFLPRIELKQAQALHRDGAVFVDARLVSDYKAGHIPNALSIPINSPGARVREVMQRVPRTTQIVTYCESLNCGFAQTVAEQLNAEGFDRVAVFAGGWLEWKANPQ